MSNEIKYFYHHCKQDHSKLCELSEILKTMYFFYMSCLNSETVLNPSTSAVIEKQNVKVIVHCYHDWIFLLSIAANYASSTYYITNTTTTTTTTTTITDLVVKVCVFLPLVH